MAVGLPAEATEEAPLVRLRDVFKIYREGTTETVALRGANLDLPRGRMTSLVGPSGSGKSTLISIIAGLTLPSAGQVLLDGVDLNRLGESERAELRARRIGIVFQSGNLIPFLSALENVEVALATAGRRRSRPYAHELLAQLGLEHRLHHRPTRLAGGEAQRVAVAVALANEPDLLIGDELTGELDSGTTSKVMGLLAEVWRQRRLTILLVTHNQELASLADHRLRIADGVVSAA